MRAPVYRHLERKQQWMGLEPVDAIALGGLLWLLLTFHRGALVINLVLLTVAFAALRLAKRGRPDGYTLALVRYSLRPRRAFLSAAADDDDGRARRYLHSDTTHTKETHHG